MKITLVLRDITEKGGGERVCVNLANAFSQKYKVKIISFYRTEQHLAYALNSDIEIVYLSHRGEKSKCAITTFFNKHIKRYFLTFKAQKEVIDSDIILANDRALAPMFKQKGKYYIRLWHLQLPKRKKDFSFFDALVVLSSKNLKKWKKIYPKVRVIPNFLPNCGDEITQYRQKICLSVGRMDRGDPKGYLRLLKIFSLLTQKHPDWKLHIVGEGILKKDLEDKIRELKLENCVVLKPYTKNIKKEYLASSFYVLTSYFEGFGMVLVESGTYGLASVSFDIFDGPSDIIEEGKSGFLIKDGDLDEFANKMSLLMENEELRSQMGKNAKQRVDSLFCQENVLKQWEKLFSTLQSHNPVLPQ